MEADWASFRAVQDLGVRIIVLRLDKSPLPKHLEIALGSQHVIDLSSSTDLQGDFVQQRTQTIQCGTARTHVTNIPPAKTQDDF
jgi:hypothetical protein